MVTGSTLPVRLCLRSLMNVSVVPVTSVIAPFSQSQRYPTLDLDRESGAIRAASMTGAGVARSFRKPSPSCP